MLLPSPLCSRYVDDSNDFRERSAIVVALLHTTFSGPFNLFQEQSTGMGNFPAG